MRFRLLLITATAATILLLISIAVNIYTYRRAAVYYRQLNLVRLDPLGEDVYSSDTIPRASAKQRIIFFGDSRAQQWPTPEDLPQFKFINRGIGSQTSAQVALRFDSHIRPLMPNVLIVQVCVNDLKTLPLFPENADAIIADCKHYLDSILAQAREIGAWVILTTVFPVGEPPIERWPFWSDTIASSINTVNDYIHSLAADDVIVMDAYALLANERGLLRPELGMDEMHLNAAGYALLNDQLAGILRAL